MFYFAEFHVGSGGFGTCYLIAGVKTVAGAKRKVADWNEFNNSLSVIVEDEPDLRDIDPYAIRAIRHNSTGKWMTGRAFSEAKSEIVDFVFALEDKMRES